MSRKSMSRFRKIEGLVFKSLFIFIIVCFAFYLLLGGLLYTFQDKLLYRPSNADFYDCPGFWGFEKAEHNGTRFYYLKDQDSKRLAVYYHGNVGSACDRSYLRYGFSSLNASIAFVEYTGYANASIQPSREKLYGDARNMHDFSQEQGFDQVSVIGASLGSGVASYHAGIGDVDDLVLLAPFYSTTSLAKAKFPFYPVEMLYKEEYDNSRWLQGYEGRFYVVHGALDENIPISQSEELYETVQTEEKTYVRVPDAAHNDLLTYRETWEVLMRSTHTSHEDLN